MRATAVVAVAAVLIAAVAGQPFNVTHETFIPGINEPTQRNESQYLGFVYNLPASPRGDNTEGNPNGAIQLSQVAQNPFLSTLPGEGNGQTLITLGPCAGNTPHVHARGSEISFMLYGAIEFGMIEENVLMNRLVFRNITQGDSIHIPQGVLHFSHNPNCEPAAFLANFGNRDPGTQTIWNSMMRVPTHILHSATGIPENLINGLKQYPLVTAPGTGSEACLARCNLRFEDANKLTPLPADELV